MKSTTKHTEGTEIFYGFSVDSVISVVKAFVYVRYGER
jgi:hypothetical protein